MRKYKTGHEKELGERLAPYKKILSNVGMAYQIIAYPLLEETDDGSCIRELISDAQAYPNERPEEFPNRKPLEITLTERKLLGSLTKDRGLPFNPDKKVYSYTELIPRRDARSAEITRRFGENARANAVDQGFVRSREEIKEEMRQRLAKWEQGNAKKPPPPGGTPKNPKSSQ